MPTPGLSGYSASASPRTRCDVQQVEVGTLQIFGLRPSADSILPENPSGSPGLCILNAGAAMPSFKALAPRQGRGAAVKVRPVLDPGKIQSPEQVSGWGVKHTCQLISQGWCEL